MVAGTFRARRGRADVCDLLQAAATLRGAFRRPPEGRAHKRPSALLSALDVCRIRPRADATHLDACGRADHSFLGGSTTSVGLHCVHGKAAGAALKTSTFLTTTLIAGSFLGFIGLVIYLAATEVVTRQMAILLVVALLGCYIGFGILIGVYRLIDKLD